MDRGVEARLTDQRVQEPRPAPGAACRACGGPAHTSLATFLSAGSIAPSSGHTLPGTTHLCFASHAPGLHPQQRWLLALQSQDPDLELAAGQSATGCAAHGTTWPSGLSRPPFSRPDPTQTCRLLLVPFHQPLPQPPP